MDGKGDGILTGKYRWIASPQFRCLDDGTWEERSTVPEWENICWRRTMKEDGALLRIRDHVTADREHHYTFLFVLDPDVTFDIQKEQILLRSEDVTLTMSFRFSVPVSWQTLPGNVYKEFQICPSLRLAAKMRGRDILGEILFS